LLAEQKEILGAEKHRRTLRDRFFQMPNRIPKALRPLLWITLLAAAGCETQQFRPGQSATVQFGTVSLVEPVQLQSDAGAGALIGGTIGLITGAAGGNAPRNAIIGAAAGGIGTAAVQGNRTGFAYTVSMIDGSMVRIISNQSEIRVGDCVAIERVGQTNNIRRESSAFCTRGNERALDSVRGDAQTAAQRCEDAKEELVKARTPEEVDMATRKASLLCN